jgi:hypothetical protein
MASQLGIGVWFGDCGELEWKDCGLAGELAALCAD